MTASPKIEKTYRCEKCTQVFKIPLRINSNEGEYNACRRCKSLHIRSVFVVDGIGEFETETEAYQAYFSMMEDLNYENKM